MRRRRILVWVGVGLVVALVPALYAYQRHRSGGIDCGRISSDTPGGLAWQLEDSECFAHAFASCDAATLHFTLETSKPTEGTQTITGRHDRGCEIVTTETSADLETPWVTRCIFDNGKPLRDAVDDTSRCTSEAPHLRTLHPAS